MIVLDLFSWYRFLWPHWLTFPWCFTQVTLQNFEKRFHDTDVRVGWTQQWQLPWLECMLFFWQCRNPGGLFQWWHLSLHICCVFFFYLWRLVSEFIFFGLRFSKMILLTHRLPFFFWFFFHWPGNIWPVCVWGIFPWPRFGTQRCVDFVPCFCGETCLGSML